MPARKPASVFPKPCCPSLPSVATGFSRKFVSPSKVYPSCLFRKSGPTTPPSSIGTQQLRTSSCSTCSGECWPSITSITPLRSSATTSSASRATRGSFASSTSRLARKTKQSRFASLSARASLKNVLARLMLVTSFTPRRNLGSMKDADP